MTIEKELLDHFLASYNYQKPEDLIGENGLLKQLTKAILERALQAEMTVHWGTKKTEPLPPNVAMPVMVKPEKPSKGISVICRLRYTQGHLYH